MTEWQCDHLSLHCIYPGWYLQSSGDMTLISTKTIPAVCKCLAPSPLPCQSPHGRCSWLSSQLCIASSQGLWWFHCMAVWWFHCMAVWWFHCMAVWWFCCMAVWWFCCIAVRMFHSLTTLTLGYPLGRWVRMTWLWSAQRPFQLLSSCMCLFLLHILIVPCLCSAHKTHMALAALYGTHVIPHDHWVHAGIYRGKLTHWQL